VRIDLHTHSSASDGTDPPAELMVLAGAAGLDVVALCDHESSAGWAAADEAARSLDIVLVRGMEISTRHHGTGVHLLAYFADPSDAALTAELGRILDGRRLRLSRVVERLNSNGIALTEADVWAQAADALAVGRPHIADALVARGLVRTRSQAFGKYLSPGRPGYVARYAAELDDMIRLVIGAGGVPVVAHPWGRGSRNVLQADDIATLAALGLAGLEVDHREHSDADRTALRAIAADVGLVVTGGSDYHGTGKTDNDLGSNLTDPDQLERLIDLADERHGSDPR
jgi:predicted metal-dependent phosphoesterase TrpH